VPRICLLIAVSSCVVACGSGSTGTPTAPSTNAGTPQTIAGCELSGSTPGTPVGQNGGPYTHNVAIATSDGRTTTGHVEVLAHASVPDAVRLPDGTIGVYYVNGETDGVWLGRLNGSTLTPVSAITIDGVLRPSGVVDPDATLVDGKVRLTYLNGFGAPGTTRAICMAESTNGLTFQTMANALPLGTNTDRTDPTIVRLADGSWLLATRDGDGTLLARSAGGTSFTSYGTFTSGSVPELALTSDGRVRLYVCEVNAGIVSHVSADGGITWTREGIAVAANAVPGRGVCDPSYLPGANLFVFKTQ
jgi:hypothetical protein